MYDQPQESLQSGTAKQQQHVRIFHEDKAFYYYTTKINEEKVIKYSEHVIESQDNSICVMKNFVTSVTRKKDTVYHHIHFVHPQSVWHIINQSKEPQSYLFIFALGDKVSV